MKIVDLPSGRKLEISDPPAPFAVSKALYQAVLDELGHLEINVSGNVANMMKDIFCTGFSSKKIEACLDECLKRVTIDKVKINEQTFEATSARQDYMDVCYEVALENLLPFTKSLYAKYQAILGKVESIQA